MKNMKVLLFLLLLLISGFSVYGATVTNVNLGYSPSTPSPDNDLLVTYSLNLEGSETAAKAVFDWKKASVSLAKLNMPFEVFPAAGSGPKDYSSNANNAAAAVGALWVYNGGYDGWGAYDFDGVDDYVLIPHSSSLNLNNFTLEARVKADVLGGGAGSKYRVIISKNTTPNRPPSLWLYNAQAGTCSPPNCVSLVQVWMGAGNFPVATSSSSLSEGTWYHLAATYDGSKIRIYIDGVLDSTTAYSTAPPTNSAALTIGQRGVNDNQYWFDGKIDEVRIYNFALSGDQVADHNGGNPDDRMKAAETASGDLWKVTLSPIGRTGTSHAEGTSVTSNELKIPYSLTACKTSGWVNGGFYSLQNDVTTTGSCMVIDASNVELSCNGHVLDGDDSGTTDYGVDVNGNLDNIKVNGCTIQDFAHGLNVVGAGSATEADNLKFENNVVQSNTRYGAKASYTNNALFAGNTFTGLASGGWSYLYLDADNDDVLAQGNTFTHPLVSGQSLMVGATTNDNVDVIGNTFTGSGSSGVGLGISDADGLDVHNNVIQSYNYGVYFYNDADNSVFYNNDFKTNSVINAYRANSFSTGNVFDSGGVGNYWDDYDTAAEGCNDVSPANGVCDAALNTANAPWNQVNPIVDNYPWTTAQN